MSVCFDLSWGDAECSQSVLNSIIPKKKKKHQKNEIINFHTLSLLFVTLRTLQSVAMVNAISFHVLEKYILKNMKKKKLFYGIFIWPDYLEVILLFGLIAWSYTLIFRVHNEKKKSEWFLFVHLKSTEKR